MKMQTSNYCSQAESERYLINKMSPEEESAFQKHLETCDVCRKYINSVRRLSCLIADEELAYTATFAKKGRKIYLRYVLSIAACLLILIGSVYFFTEHEWGVSYHHTLINQQHKADKAVMELELLFPDKDLITLSADTPVIFKWNMDAEYKLTLRYEHQIILEVEDYGESYTPDAKIIGNHPVIDWILNINDKEFKGKIIYK